MSYLLTEIALEMLGYKYYDADGQYHVTNFQQQTPPKDLHPNEPTLQVYLASNSIPVSILSDGDNTTKEISKDIFVNKSTKEIKTNMAGIGTETTRSLTLVNLLNNEYRKLRMEIIEKVKEERTNDGNHIHNKDELQLKKQIAEFFTQQQFKLATEVTILRKFRSQIEMRLYKSSPRPYEKYIRNFGATKYNVDNATITTIGDKIKNIPN